MKETQRPDMMSFESQVLRRRVQVANHRLQQGRRHVSGQDRITVPGDVLVLEGSERISSEKKICRKKQLTQLAAYSRTAKTKFI